MEPQEVGEVIGNSLAKIIGQLFGFRTALALLNTACVAAGGWIDSLAYRDCGERYLRGMFGSVWPALGLAAQMIGLTAIYHRWPTPIIYLILVWAGALRYADWMSALDRRKREQTEGYTYSKFIGWCRFLPATQASSYVRQAWIIVAVGGLFFILDPIGGTMLVIAGTSLLLRQWIIGALRREDAMDALDAEWEAEQRARVKVRTGGADLTSQDVATAQIVSTADFIRHYSTGPSGPVR